MAKHLGNPDLETITMLRNIWEDKTDKSRFAQVKQQGLFISLKSKTRSGEGGEEKICLDLPNRFSSVPLIVKKNLFLKGSRCETLKGKGDHLEKRNIWKREKGC